MQFDTIVVIARFDPVHAGHIAILEQALELAPHVAVVIGSAYRPRSARHPWTVAERQAQIEVALQTRPSGLTFSAVSDHLYSEDAWAAEVRDRLADVAGHRGTSEGRVGLLAGPQQQEEKLQQLFPEWVVIKARESPLIDAQKLRAQVFSEGRNSDAVLEPVRNEYAFLRQYWKSWSVAPYPVNFVTVDALVTHRGHVLLIRRLNQPGQGLLALPGGFLDVNEPIRDAAIRELREETGLEISASEASQTLQRQACFDTPGRSLRGRTITHVFHFNLSAHPQPVVEAADDAAQAEWIPITQALRQEDQFFEDHFDILEFFFRGLP